MLSSLRVLKIWIHCKYKKDSVFHFPSNFEVLYLCEFLRYDNDQIMKKYLFLLKNMIFVFLLARALPRALRATLYTPKMWILATFQSTWCCTRNRRACKCSREILVRANGYKMKNWIFFIFTMYSYLQNSQRWKHLKFSKFCHKIAFCGKIPEIGAAHL